MIITLCSSADFFDKIARVKNSLESLEHKVLMPSMRKFADKEAVSKARYHLLREHFDNIDKSDAILVANYDNKGIRGYIGGSCLLEMGKAFDRRIPIFLINDIPKMSYSDEIIALKPIVIGEDYSLIEWTT